MNHNWLVLENQYFLVLQEKSPGPEYFSELENKPWKRMKKTL